MQQKLRMLWRNLLRRKILPRICQITMHFSFGMSGRSKTPHCELRSCCFFVENSWACSVIFWQLYLDLIKNVWHIHISTLLTTLELAWAKLKISFKSSFLLLRGTLLSTKLCRGSTAQPTSKQFRKLDSSSFPFKRWLEETHKVKFAELYAAL